MSNGKRALGKGLEALLGGGSDLSALERPLERDGSLSTIPIEQITRSPYQPRRQFDDEALDELADSIRAQGLVQPIVVRAVGDRYELVAGERRWRAAQRAGLHDMPALVRTLDDRAAAAIALIENIQRKDLNPLEEASALKRLQQDFSLTHAEVAEAVGRSRAAVSNLLRLLDLHPEVKALVDSGRLEMGHARALLSLEGSDQLAVAQAVVERGLSVRATEALVKERLDPGKRPPARRAPDDPNIRKLAEELGERLGAPVEIRTASKGRGVVEIRYSSLVQLDGILGRIR
ncbi:MAG: ParB/RepB/Spo0J family partition protein [Pseudomonadota bacterium]